MAIEASSVPLSETIMAGGPPPGDQGLQLPDNPSTREGRVGDQRRAFPAAAIDHRQDPEPPPAGQCIADEVQAPAHVRCLRHQRTFGASGTSIGRRVPKARLRPPAHLRLLLAVERHGVFGFVTIPWRASVT